MPDALLPLALLACPLGMGLMMFFMMRGMRGGQKTPMSDHNHEASPTERLRQLEAEKRAIEEQLQLAAAENAKLREHSGATAELKKAPAK